MSELPHRWCAYARCQEDLKTKIAVDRHSWGLEAQLNRLVAEDGATLSEAELERIAQSESRKERHRAQLRETFLVADKVTASPEESVYARTQLQATRSGAGEDGWTLLCELGAGHGYGEIAVARGVSTGSLRVRAARLRRALTGPLPQRPSSRHSGAKASARPRLAPL